MHHAGLLPGDQREAELQLCVVVLGLLGPPDQQGAVAVDPGVDALNDPAAGPFPVLAAQLADLLATAAHVRRERELTEEFAHELVVVGLVQAHALLVLRRLRTMS